MFLKILLHRRAAANEGLDTVAKRFYTMGDELTPGENQGLIFFINSAPELTYFGERVPGAEATCFTDMTNEFARRFVPRSKFFVNTHHQRVGA